MWGSAYATHLKKLVVLQKKIVRIMCCVNSRAHTDPLFHQLGILKISDINKYLIGKFVFKWYHRDLPSLFNDVFVAKADIHEYDTRGRQHQLHIPLVKTNLGKQNIRFRGAIIWNSIVQAHILPGVSDFVFSKSLKRLLMVDYV